MSYSPPVPIRVAVVGLGTIGRRVATAIGRDAEMRLAGLVDTDPRVAGKRLADLGVDSADDATIVDDIERLDAVDVAIVCAGPQFDRIAPTLRQLMRKKAHVVSSCEQMTWPWLNHPHLADVIAGEARKAGVTLIGVGADPATSAGALALPLMATRLGVTRVSVTRTLDLTGQRDALLRRSGVTMTPTQFRALAKERRIGHVGLGEIAVVLAQSLGRHPMRGDVRLTTAPRFAEHDMDTPIGQLKPGHVSGVVQSAEWSGDGIEVRMELIAALDTGSVDTQLLIDADSAVRVALPADLFGDAFTAAALVNAARTAPRVSNGLRTILDLPPVGSR